MILGAGCNLDQKINQEPGTQPKSRGDHSNDKGGHLDLLKVAQSVAGFVLKRRAETRSR